MMVKLQKRWILLASVCTYLLLLLSWNLNHGYSSRKFLFNVSSEKSIAEANLIQLEDMLTSNGLNDETKLKLVTKYVKTKLDAIQTKSNCGTILHCGHDDSCGLGCQLHHRSLCLAMSLVLNLPLVHSGLNNWPYHDKWDSVFKPLGSSCSLEASQVRFVVDWWKPCSKGSLIHIEKWSTVGNVSVVEIEGEFGFTFAEGLPMPGFLADVLNVVHPNPMTWVVGMFLNLTMQLNEELEEELRIISRPFSRTGNVIGAHVRRTDKINEAAESVHQVSEYADQAFKFHRKFSENPDSTVDVFVATDDPAVLDEFRSKYQAPRWRFWSSVNEDLPNGSAVAQNLKSIVKDVFMLARQDFTICGFSSNVCRLIWELKTFQGFLDLKDRFHSLDDEYKMILLCNPIPQKVIKYEGWSFVAK